MFKKRIGSEVVIKGMGLVLAVSALAMHADTASAQQIYPGKQIRFIVPFPAGGSTTPPARIVGQKLTESWGQQVIIDNRGGGNTIIGSEALVKSPPDGYTILLSSPAYLTLPFLAPLPYDTIKDFAPVTTIVRGENVLVVHPALPVSNLKGLIALAKSRPGQLNYATSGAGGIVHLASELFSSAAGIKLQHVPYKGGGAQLLTDLIGGQIQLSFQGPISVFGFVNSGKLKGMAISGSSRLTQLPQVPTFTEAGLAGFDAGYWNGVLAPAGTPKAIIDKLAAEIGRILAMPDTRETLLSLALVPYISTPEQTAALIKADLAKYEKVIKSANIKLEN